MTKWIIAVLWVVAVAAFAQKYQTVTGNGNSNTATALAANGANCSAGQFPLGVDASGASESCTALPTTISGTSNEISSSASTGAITLSLPSTVNFSSKVMRIPNSTTLPGTCTTGDAYMDTDGTSGQRFYLCESTNTWQKQGDGGGVGSGITSLASQTGSSQTITRGAGIGGTSAGDDHSFTTASDEADFLKSGALTCGASTQGKMQVHTTPLQYCDNAATPTLQYAAYGNSSGVATSATILATTRAIYGNNFDGSAALTQIIASTYGGTGNGFFKVSGPATAERTMTFPNADATILYSGGALGTPSGGTATNLTGLPLTTGVTGLLPLANGGTNCATPYAINPQTTTYQVLAADFTCSKTISVASGTFTITLVASGSQPVAGSWIRILNYGSGVVTVARSGQNINGGTTSLTLAAGSATSPTGAVIASDGTDYFAQTIGINTTVSIAQGGTGQTAKTAAFDALSPVTTRGDLIVRDASNNVRLAKGTQYQVLTGGANDPTWTSVALDQSTAVSGILPSTNGGTGNGFAKFSGPATSEKTFTLPNATSTILTDNAAVTVAQGGTGLTSGTSGGVPYYSSSSAITSSAALASGGVVLGGGAGAAPTTGGGYTISTAGSAGTAATNMGTATTLARSDHEHLQSWQTGLIFEATPATGTYAAPMPVNNQCGGSINAVSVSITALTQGSALTFNVIRYNNAASSQGNVFSGTQTYNTAGNARQDFSTDQNATGIGSTDYFRINIVTITSTSQFSVQVQGTCKTK